jgi:HlyD family secretion protein
MSSQIRRCSAALAAVLALTSCKSAQEDAFPGYAEGEYVRIASAYAGSLQNLNVKRGDRVPESAPLFALEQESENAARSEAAARLAQAQARLANLGKGKRPEEVAAVRAQLAQAQASERLTQAELKRTQNLVNAAFLSLSKLDEVRSAHERDRARVSELTAQLKIAALAGRPDEIAAAQAEVKAQKAQRAPRAALVADTFYSAGEWVQAGMPVVSLLPPENIKLKFFIPEAQRGALKIGQEVSVRCDGCQPVSAKISYVAPQAEYTSPLIYSKENRAALVFLVEARPKAEDAVKLHPGQPVEIKL